MKCPKCSQELAPETRQCPRCGTTFSGPQQAVPPPAKSKRKVAFIAGGALLIIIIAAFIAHAAFSGNSITQGGEPTAMNGPSVTNAPPANLPSGPSVTNAPPAAPPPTGPGDPNINAPKVPQEVLDYLEFVKGIEAKRQKLLGDTTRAVSLAAGQAQAESILDMINMTMDDTGKAEQEPKKVTSVEKELGAQINNWNGLIREFDSKPAPQQCAGFAGAYRIVIVTETVRMSAIMNTIARVNWSDMESVKKALSDLQSMKGDPNLQGGIDKAVESADGSLAGLCSQYGIQKSFEVKKETDTGGSITGGF